MHAFDMRAHRIRSTIAIAAHDGDYDAIMFGMRLREPPQITKLGPTKWLHALAGRERDLGDMAVLRAGIDRAVKLLVHLMKAVRIAGMAQHPKLFVDCF